MPITLMLHNIEAYGKVNEDIEKNNKTAVIQPTGTGKMYIGLKYVEDNKGKKTMYIAPSNAILHDVKKNIFAEGMTMQDFPNLKRITYQKLATLSDEEIEKLEADIIIIDEFHHCGAPVWGKGVERLIERNPNAKILGFSATPIRYNDGLRDMADEMFENNVASEMTLEEAIDRGILPGATYVSTLYGYEQELGKMQANIDNTKASIENRKQAQELLDELRKKLDENTQNLPELLAEHMKNKSGKYIVFCKNIDDMNEKMEQAQKMFGGVNSNIKVRGVSSKIKETDRILTEFEQDNEEGTLKLLYAVDMISEGYHVKDLDGVVMMRPTYSPTVFTQQLGRGLTVGNDKETVILDLVNNFDSCKIIEDLAEKMKQYKGREGTGEKEKRKSSRLSIFDTTKEFREIAERITELTKRRTISLEEKIEIFERFAKTEEELVGNTTFEGYPIGQWAIQIRSSINRINRGNANKGELNLSETQLERLEKLGILERQIDSTIEEKIDAIIEWNKQYPVMRLDEDSHLYADRYLLEQDERLLRIHDEDELTDGERYDRIKNISERFEKLKKYYDYVKQRKNQGKLTEVQISRCKEGNVRGVFGYPESTEQIANDYNYNIDRLDYILSRYGTISNYLVQEHLGWDEKKFFEINLNNDVGIERLIASVQGFRGGTIYNRDVVLEQLNRIEFSDNPELSENRRKALMKYYGINEEKKYAEDIAKEINVSTATVHNYINIALKTLRKHEKDFDITYIPNFYKIDEEDRKKIVDALGNYAFGKPDKYNIENLNKLVDICKTIEKYGSTRISDEEKEKRDIEGQIEDLQSQIEVGNIPIEKLDLTIREYNSLRRAGIQTVQDIIDYDKKYEGYGLEKIRNLSSRGANEIRRKIEIYREILEADSTEIEDLQEISPEEEERLERERILETSVEELDLSARSFNILKKARINSLQDLLHKSKKELLKFRGMGKATSDEIISKLSEYGIVFNEDGELDFEDTQEQTELNDGISIEQLDLSARSYNGLHRAGIKTVQDIIDRDEEDGLKRIRNLGKKSIYEIREKIAVYRVAQKDEAEVEDLQDEAETIEEDTEVIEEKEEKTELELLKEKRDKLLEKQRKIQEKIAQAKELSASYDRLNGNLQENETPNLDDE